MILVAKNRWLHLTDQIGVRFIKASWALAGTYFNELGLGEISDRNRDLRESPNINFCVFRMHGSPDLTYGDFIIVQSVWGMTQGMAFPLHGLVIKATNE